MDIRPLQVQYMKATFAIAFGYTVELRHIRYFLAVADERNFTRAAARVGIGQPPLSQQIRDLETEVGMPLFRRVPHGAELTEAGTAFRAAIEAIPGQVAHAVAAAQRAGRGETGVLRVGFTGSLAMNPLVPMAFRAFRRRYPDVELTLTEGNSTTLGNGLRDGSIDVAFMRPGVIDVADMKLAPLPDEPMVLALPSAHRLLAHGDESTVRLADLAEDMFILTPRVVGPTLFDEAINACRSVGFEPRLGQTAPQIASVLSLVAAEQGVSIVPLSMRQLALAGVVYRTIADAAPTARLALAHLRSNHAVMIRNFLTTVEGREIWAGNLS
ncbi:putative transcriptional regulator [Novosphingobium nitrogenifigens DSM 19370]|uniref:Putative transcriptional regulator n=1 Tax=Novosphingobium nitrogenifigens DSM 19370 TaxID=983920 RepID=F1Z807_9SPHN|nr:putative transcriptional regulator [Novosphingobium nitrogenifigens DSM 19370]